MNHFHETTVAGRKMKVEFGKIGMLSDAAIQAAGQLPPTLLPVVLQSLRRGDFRQMQNRKALSPNDGPSGRGRSYTRTWTASKESRNRR